MHPEIAKTMVNQHREDLMRHTAESRRFSARSGWLSRRFPRWHVSWSRTVLSPAGVPGTPVTSARPDRPAKRGSSLVIIISAYRSA